MQRDYQSPTLRELRDQQIRFAPRAKKLQQVEAAERLIAEIDSEKTYPYDYVCFRVTGYRPTEPMPSKIGGEDLRHDLRLFVEDLSDSADMAADNVGPILSAHHRGGGPWQHLIGRMLEGRCEIFQGTGPYRPWMTVDVRDDAACHIGLLESDRVVNGERYLAWSTETRDYEDICMSIDRLPT